MNNLAKWILDAIRGCDYDCADWDEDAQKGLAVYIAKHVYDHMTLGDIGQDVSPKR